MIGVVHSKNTETGEPLDIYVQGWDDSESSFYYTRNIDEAMDITDYENDFDMMHGGKYVSSPTMKGEIVEAMKKKAYLPNGHRGFFKGDVVQVNTPFESGNYKFQGGENGVVVWGNGPGESMEGTSNIGVEFFSPVPEAPEGHAYGFPSYYIDMIDPASGKHDQIQDVDGDSLVDGDKAEYLGETLNGSFGTMETGTEVQVEGKGSDERGGVIVVDHEKNRWLVPSNELRKTGMKKKAELPQTDKICQIDNELHEKAGYPESGEFILQEPWSTEFVDRVKKEVGPVNDDVIRELEDINYHSAIKLLVMNGLTTGDYYTKETYAMYKKADITNFLADYMECALWSSTDNSDDSGGEPLDRNYTTDDFAPGEEQKARTDCENFMQQAEAAGLQLNEKAGHDFWLTRNHHGDGFWDGDYDKATGERLTEIAQTFGETSIEVGDDGKLYFFP
jgi:hypothetical protein